MSGRFTGVQLRCKEKNPFILFVHCYGYCLYLSLVSTCTKHKENPKICDFFGIVQLIYNFIVSNSKRHSVFEKIMKSINSTLKMFKSLSETRWVCCSSSISAVYQQIDAIVAAIAKSINDTCDSKTRAQGKGILNQIKSFDFTITLEMIHPTLQLIVRVSKTLQSRDISYRRNWELALRFRGIKDWSERIWQHVLQNCRYIQSTQNSDS